ncbi:MAG: alpha/beta fold hydrolase [Pirellulaceae bacterium]|nr:alpha/beta fold hydrolase [Pirellulaceae bacterium]
MKRRLKLTFYAILALVGVWLLGDFIYSQVVAARMRSWEATVDRDPAGVRIGCEDFAVGDGERALLFVHGINDSPACWREMAAVCAERGFHCRAMRLPGFAMPTEQYAAATREQWLAAVGGELRQLRREHTDVTLVGHSLGGAICVAYALDHPDEIDRIVLAAPAIAVSSERSFLFSTARWHAIGNYLLFFTRVTESPFSIDARQITNADYPFQTPFAPRSTVDETFALIDNNRGRGGDLQPPLMMILSKDDVVIDWRAAEEFARQANAELRFVEDTGHAMTIDHKWPELVEHIVEFSRAEPSGEQGEP